MESIWEDEEFTTQIKRFTERDFEILLDLYHHRILTTQQIKKYYFKSNAYAYRRMYLLKKDGLIEGSSWVRWGGKSMSTYQITDRGIYLLQREGKIENNIRRARDNMLNETQLNYVIDVNEVYLQLKPYGWSMLDSREVKRKYEMNRANLVQGILKDSMGKGYGIYVVENEPHEITVKRILTEIRDSDITDYIVFCKGKSSYNTIKQQVSEMGVVVGGSLCVLPYNNGIRILKALRSDAHIENLYRQYGEVKLIPNFGSIRHMIIHNGEPKLITQLLTGDLMIRDELYYYNRDRYAASKKKIVVLAWRDQQAEFLERFSHYPHIEFIWLLRQDVLK